MAHPHQYLVTGGAGFIGSHIALRLLDRGDRVRILDDLSSGKRANLAALGERAELVAADVRDLDAVRKAAAGVEVIFHHAAMSSVSGSIADPLASLQVNVVGAQNVLVAAREAGVRRVVYASSSSVYGDLPILPKREETPTDPKSPYAAQKLAAEQLCRITPALYGLETVALRYFNVYGPRQDPTSAYAAVIPRFLRALLSGERPAIYGDGEQTRDFIYVGDVVTANLLAAETPEVGFGQVFNIGGGESITINEILRLAAEVCGAPYDPVYLDARAGDVRDSRADINYAGHLLGFRPATSLRDGLALTVEAMRAAL